MLDRFLPGAFTTVVSLVALSAAQPVLDEESLHLSFTHQGVDVAFAVAFDGTSRCSTDVALDWLDAAGVSHASSRARLDLTPGRDSYSLRLPLPKARTARQLNAFWDRLRFRFESAAGHDCLGTPGESLVSVSRVQADWFRLELGLPEIVGGSKIPVVVRAVNPATGAGVAGVTVDLELSHPSGPAAHRRVTTNLSGIALLDFARPPGVTEDDEEPVLRARAALGPLTAEQEADIWVRSLGEAILDTDKDIYQPGETINIRAVMFGPNGRAMPDAQASIVIDGPEGGEAHALTAESNRFGVLAAEYRIPENGELGDYGLWLEALDPNVAVGAAKRVRVSRYERPLFEVRANPSATSFLPSESITLVVSAQTFVGKPVPAGRVTVRVVGGDDEPVAEGRLDQQGRLELTLAAFEDEVRNRKLEVAVEDPVSRRIERDELIVHVAKRPIRLRVRGLDGPWSSLGTRAYVRSENRDGSPAAGRLRVFLLSGEEKRELWRGRTTAGGTAVVDLDLSAETDGRLLFEFQDNQGRKGRKRPNLYRSELDEGLRLRSDQAIYQPGEPIVLSLAAEIADGSALVSIHRDSELLALRSVVLKKGRAQLRVPSTPEFHGVLAIQARATDALWQDSGDALLFVEFPARTDLQIRSRFDRKTYQPGQDIRLRFDVRGPDGRPAEAAIGVAAVDPGVIRRAQTLGATPEAGPAPVRLTDEERQTHAAVLLNFSRQRYDEWEYHSDRPPQPAPLYSDLLQRSAQRAVKLLEQVLHSGVEPPPYPDAVRKILAARGLRWDEQLDPWGNPSRLTFLIVHGEERLAALSAGPDERFGTADDQSVDMLRWPYFDSARDAVERALAQAPRFPQDDQEFHAAMQAAGVAEELVSDPWGRPYKTRLAVETLKDMPRYDAVWYANFDGDATRRAPERMRHLLGRRQTLTLLSSGPSGSESFAVSRFYDSVDLQAHREFVHGGSPLRGEPAKAASITGVVTDATGASIPGCEVIAVGSLSGRRFETRTDPVGRYLLDNLPPGVYRIQISADGFRTLSIYGVPVREAFRTQADGYLEIGAVTEVVEVSAQPALLQTSTTSMAMAVSTPPRIRKDFPETLLWAPFVETDADGRAELSFQAADQITTWQVEAFATTLDGRRLLHKTELEVFQPVYLDYNPPPTLTSGDRVDVPLIVRNYRDKPVRLRAGAQGIGGVQASLPGDDTLELAANETAALAVRLHVQGGDQEEARQTVAVTARGASDAVEKTVRIRPDGELRHEVYSVAAHDRSSLDFTLPAEALEGTVEVSLRTFPNLSSHVVHSVHALLKRPYGCGEQTISSTFPNALALGYLSDAGRLDSAEAEVARSNLEAGYRRLLGYRAPSGGFRYFNGREPDRAITAYALEFLEAASEWIEVDPEVVHEAQGWLKSRLDGTNIQTRTLALGVLARQGRAAEIRATMQPPDVRTLYGHAALLRLFVAVSDREAAAKQALRMIESLDDRQPSTPFYGGGQAAQAEALGLAAKALVEARQIGVEGLDQALGRAISGLLRLKDRDGLWPSTQAVIRALVAFRAVAGRADQPVEVRLNGLDSPSAAPGDPVDVGELIRSGANRLELNSPGWAMAQVVVEYAVPWSDKPRRDQNLVFDVRYQQTRLQVGQTAEVLVEAGRSRGSGGMLIAEIGLPPGSEVDRVSLENLRTQGVYHYDVLPDAVILYLWPRADEVPKRLRFRFRARLAMDAVSAPSRLYDYYNPEVTTARRPTRFQVADHSMSM